jgi:hypothetical protein
MIFKTAVSLLFVATALHVRAAPPVPAAPPLPVGVAVNVVDFQGNVFDINGRLTAPLTAISTLNHKPGEPAQAVSTISFSPFFVILKKKKKPVAPLRADWRDFIHCRQSLCGDIHVVHHCRRRRRRR